MAVIRAVPEFRLILDPDTSVLAREREDVVQYSLEPVMAQLEELDRIVTDMMNQLGPTAELLSSFPGREKTSYIAGIFTNSVYGLVVGLILGFLILVIIAVKGG